MTDQGMPNLSLDMEVAENEYEDGPRPFVGEIVTDQYQPKRADFGGGWQWHLAVKPFEYTLKGSGAWHEFIDTKDLKDGKLPPNSKITFHLDAFKEVFGSSGTPVGKGEFVGKIAVWVREHKTWGINRKTGEEIRSTVLYPVRLATDEEMKSIGRLGANDSTDFEYTEALIEEALDVLDGTPKNKVKSTVMSAGISDPVLAQKLLSGEAINYLVDNSLLVLDGNTYARNEAA